MKKCQINTFALKSPYVLGLIITNRCNLECIHCINRANNNKFVELPFEDIIGLIDQTVKYDIPAIDFNGGEPFMRDDFNELLDYAINKKRLINITTNGTLISDKWIEKYHNKISLLRISIDSPFEKVHDKFRGMYGAYRKTTETIRKLTALDYKIIVQTAVSKLNQNNIRELINLLEEIGAIGLNIVFLIPAGRGEKIKDLALSPQELRKFLVNLEKESVKSHLFIIRDAPQAVLLKKENPNYHHKCGAAFTEMVVLNNGYVLPCAAFIDDIDSLRDNSINIYHHDLMTIYKESKIFKQVRAIHMIEGKCKNCDFIKFCGGGCRAAAYHLTKNIFAEDPLCWYEPITS